MKTKLRQAFDATASGYSVDRVVADPEFNQLFLAECRQLGLEGADSTLNRALLALRKRGELRGLKSKKSSFANQDQCQFAAEMATRFIERRDGVSLDDIICDPSLAQQFDEVAAQISPGFNPVEYRWAALYLRKVRHLKPEILSRVVTAERVSVHRVAALKIAEVPNQQGLYLFFSASQALYAGEAQNLNGRIRKHLDHSDNRGLAHWLWEQGSDEMHLELHTLSAGTATRVRRALELEMIRSRNPTFNINR